MDMGCSICGIGEVHGTEVEGLEKGCLFEANGHNYGPVEDDLALDPIKITEALGMRPEDAVTAKLQASMIKVKRPMTIDDLAKILEKVIEGAIMNKVVAFLYILSTYLEESQFNAEELARAPSPPVLGAPAGGDFQDGDESRGI